MHFDLYKSTSRQSNLSIKKGYNLLSEANGLKQPRVALHHHKVLHLFRIQFDPLGGDHIAGDGKDPLRFRWSSRHWEDHFDELGKKGELRLVMLPTFQWWFVGVTFGWVVFAQKTLCNGAIKIVSKVSPNFGCLFLWNNTVLLDGRLSIDEVNRHWLYFNSFSTSSE